MKPMGNGPYEMHGYIIDWIYLFGTFSSNYTVAVYPHERRSSDLHRAHLLLGNKIVKKGKPLFGKLRLLRTAAPWQIED